SPSPRTVFSERIVREIIFDSTIMSICHYQASPVYKIFRRPTFGDRSYRLSRSRKTTLMNRRLAPVDRSRLAVNINEQLHREVECPSAASGAAEFSLVGKKYGRRLQKR
ncbi:MAG: hypothetical protein WCG76_10475, partial [Verrucomicrobiota bacterium]